jgi:hypothetical protein
LRRRHAPARGRCSWSQRCGGAQSPAITGATRCDVVDHEDMGGAIAKIARRPWGGRRRGGKGMACDVGVTRGENGRSRSRTRFVATLVRGAC